MWGSKIKTRNADHMTAIGDELKAGTIAESEELTAMQAITMAIMDARPVVGYPVDPKMFSAFRYGKDCALAAAREALHDWQARTPPSPTLDQVTLEEVVEEVIDAIKCFNAAGFEGLSTVLAETEDERLKDLVERRLLYAENHLSTALTLLTRIKDRSHDRS